MADFSEQRFSRLSTKMALFTERYRHLAELSAQQAQRVTLLEETVRGLNGRIATLQKQQEADAAAYALMSQGRQAKLLRRRLLGFVREIDRCIADLNASQI